MDIAQELHFLPSLHISSCYFYYKAFRRIDKNEAKSQYQHHTEIDPNPAEVFPDQATTTSQQTGTDVIAE